MWKKQQEQTKPTSSAPQSSSNVSTAVATRVEPPAPPPAVQPTPVAVSPAPVSSSPVTPPRPVSVPVPAGIPGHLSKSLVIKGEITGREDLFIDGVVEGKIKIDDGVVTVGPNGRVDAEVFAREIVVHGKVKGNLNGRDRVQISQTGRANGNVVTRRISVDDGAEIHGNVEITPAEETRSLRKSADTPQPVLVRPQEPSTVA